MAPASARASPAGRPARSRRRGRGRRRRRRPRRWRSPGGPGAWPRCRPGPRARGSAASGSRAHHEPAPRRPPAAPRGASDPSSRARAPPRAAAPQRPVADHDERGVGELTRGQASISTSIPLAVHQPARVEDERTAGQGIAPSSRRKVADSSDLVATAIYPFAIPQRVICIEDRHAEDHGRQVGHQFMISVVPADSLGTKQEVVGQLMSERRNQRLRQGEQRDVSSNKIGLLTELKLPGP